MKPTEQEILFARIDALLAEIISLMDQWKRERGRWTARKQATVNLEDEVLKVIAENPDMQGKLDLLNAINAVNQS